ncbi:NAD(P)/FAD-dependent oxidoreductase [Paraburkholderia caffeinilytica]|uniref:NAD(P)/FAD-dependent oxidoreductase n=1 Tax=Paraburkholderia caffeinilytica TaxID=1761016 RepID=UPI003DA03EED
MSKHPVVIVGTGLAGFQAASALRDEGYAGRIVLIGDEVHLPYHRPPLSKGYLLDGVDEVRLRMRPETFYADKQIHLLGGRRAVAIDRANRSLRLDDGAVLDYAHLVLAVGASNRRLTVPGSTLGNVLSLRTLGDAHAIRERLRDVRRLVVIGAGFIGLEIAAAALKSKVEVTVIDVADRPMARAVSPATSAVFALEHSRNGVRFMFNAQVQQIAGEQDRATGVDLADGTHVAGDLIVVGIGVQPNIELAMTADLAVRNGIVVDCFMRTADPHISAIGDCAAHPNSFAQDQEVRLESVQNATDQARCVAAGIVGRAIPYRTVPWFWSDQGGLKLQIAGLIHGYDQTVVRNDPQGIGCTVFCFRQGRLVGVETVNQPANHMAARRVMASVLAGGQGITPQQAADSQFDLREAAAPVHPA